MLVSAEATTGVDDAVVSVEGVEEAVSTLGVDVAVSVVVGVELASGEPVLVSVGEPTGTLGASGAGMPHFPAVETCTPFVTVRQYGLPVAVS